MTLANGTIPSCELVSDRPKLPISVVSAVGLLTYRCVLSVWMIYVLYSVSDNNSLKGLGELAGIVMVSLVISRIRPGLALVCIKITMNLVVAAACLT